MNFAEKYAILKSLEPFSSMKPDDVAVVADACFYYNFEPSARVAQCGNIPTHVFFAFEGSIDYRGEKKCIFPPQIILSYSEFAADAFADSEVGAKCLVLTREHFFAAVRNCPRILTRLVQLQNEKAGE